MNTPSTHRLQSIRQRPGLRANLLVASALVVASLGAIAQTVAPLSRADVAAELARARAAGDIERSMSESFGLGWMHERKAGASASAGAAVPAATGHEAQTRRKVSAELARARQAGELDYASAEVGIAQPVVRSPSLAFASGIGRAEATRQRDRSATPTARQPLPQEAQGE